MSKNNTNKLDYKEFEQIILDRQLNFWKLNLKQNFKREGGHLLEWSMDDS